MGTTDLRWVGVLAAVAIAFWLLSESGRVEPPSVPIRSARHSPAKVSGVLTRVDVEQVPAVATQEPVPAACPVPAARPAPAPPTRIRVVVRLGSDVHGVGLPEPELLRLDEYGQPWPVAAKGRKTNRLHPALVLASQKTPQPQERQTSRTFEVTKPGRYVAAWHLWRNVEGTRTWRVCRGRGPEIHLSGNEGARELVVHVGAADLQLDPALDARPTNAHTTLTSKDG